MKRSLPLLLALLGLVAPGIAADKPNILFIFVDDLSWADLGYNGSTFYESPNIDQLAKESVQFNQFYSAGPVCSPTRASVLTGRYPARVGVNTFLLEPKGDLKRGNAVTHLPLDEVTMGEAFKELGYATGYIGKWHLGYEEKHWASHQGFDFAVGGMDLPWAWKLCHPDKEMPPLDRNKDKHLRFFSPHHLTHLKNGPEGEYLTERLTNETIGFINRNTEKPFFAFLSFHTVHTPLQAKPEVVEKYTRKLVSSGLNKKKETWNGQKGIKRLQNNPNYASMVQHLDENVGRLLKHLDDTGLSENTIVVFTSDNGGKGSVTSNYPLAGQKHDLREGGIRIPTLVRWTNTLKPGERETPLISNDFFPTLLDLTGSPLQPDHHVDGVSFKDVLMDKSLKAGKREALYWFYPAKRQEAAIRKGDYKLYYFLKTKKVQLYNLKKDGKELHDISTEQAELTEALKEELLEWMKLTIKK